MKGGLGFCTHWIFCPNMDVSILFFVELVSQNAWDLRPPWQAFVAAAPLEGEEKRPVECSKSILRLGWKLKTISQDTGLIFFWWFLCEIWRPQRCNKFLYNACGFKEVLNVIWTCNPVFWRIGFQHGHRDLSEGNEALQVFKAICFDLLCCACCGALPDSKSTTSPN